MNNEIRSSHQFRNLLPLTSAKKNGKKMSPQIKKRCHQRLSRTKTEWQNRNEIRVFVFNANKISYILFIFPLYSGYMFCFANTSVCFAIFFSSSVCSFGINHKWQGILAHFALPSITMNSRLYIYLSFFFYFLRKSSLAIIQFQPWFFHTHENVSG